MHVRLDRRLWELLDNLRKELPREEATHFPMQCANDSGQSYPPAPAKPSLIKTLHEVTNPNGGDSGDGYFPKYKINGWQFFANILDCATNPTGDGNVDPSDIQGPWPDSQGGLPKCYYSIGVTKYGNSNAGTSSSHRREQ